jgi:hypothetical protein
MTLLSPPISRGGPAPDDLDRRLGALFQAQLPDPWPPAPATVSGGKAPTRWPLWRSRLALAASVALLATGLLFLSGSFQTRQTSAGSALPVNGPSADSGNNPLDHPTRPAVTIPSGAGEPTRLKIDESLIQEPNGTTIRVEVRDWPTPPK